jgi:hypothetical protein
VELTDADHMENRLMLFHAGVSTTLSNCRKLDTDGFGRVGTGMTESSGIFTFPVNRNLFSFFSWYCIQILM